MNKYEAKQAARRERLEDRAARATRDSNAIYARAKSMAGHIPFGQPILVGHHSEGRDRNYRKKIHNTFAKSFALSEKADYYEQRAAAVGTGGISSDDPDAIAKLTEQLNSCEAMQALMKRANACIRKNDRDGLTALGFTAERADQLFTKDFCGRIGFPDYKLTNNNANIRRLRDRIAVLSKRSEATDFTVEAHGYTYREDVEDNRVMFEFPGKPSDDVRTLLKRHAFKWSPTRGTWVRQLTNAARYAATEVRKVLDAKA
jgi:hypothetical protein